MKTALVCGAGGFIGHHLVKRLVRDGYETTGVDLKRPEFGESHAHHFKLIDLRTPEGCAEAVGDGFDEVYQLAADMGGMGFIHRAECEIVHNSALINTHMADTAIRKVGVPKYFFSSSACVYRDMDPDEPDIDESGAYPAQPDNEYGWEKLYAERVALTYARHYDTRVYIARFENCYGPEGTWRGGREKAPAALSRKVAEIDGQEGEIEIWGDGSALRYYTYVDDMIDGIRRLVDSDLNGPTNIGTWERVSVKELAETIAKVAGKTVRIKPVEGPVGVRSRNFSKDKIRSLGWAPRHNLEQGIGKTYPWVEEQVRTARPA